MKLRAGHMERISPWCPAKPQFTAWSSALPLLSCEVGLGTEKTKPESSSASSSSVAASSSAPSSPTTTTSSYQHQHQHHDNHNLVSSVLTDGTFTKRKNWSHQTSLIGLNVKPWTSQSEAFYFNSLTEFSDGICITPGNSWNVFLMSVILYKCILFTKKTWTSMIFLWGLAS